MASRRLKIIHHQDSLTYYIGEWRLMMNHVLKIQPPVGILQELVSLDDNTRDLSIMLSYLDVNLIKLEETPLIAGQQFDCQAYSDVRTFLKICYLLVRILFDDVSGVIKYFYDKNEPNSDIPKSFNKLLNRAKRGELPEDLSILLSQTIEHFPEMRRRRGALQHDYESILVSFERDEAGKTIPGHFSAKERNTKEYGGIRKYFGCILCEFHNLVDNLLDHFDTKFMDWYRFKPHRASTIIVEGYVGIMLWWAHKYGGYNPKDLQVIENNQE